MMCGDYSIYAHINSLNGKIYIGITSWPPEKRWSNGHGYKRCHHFCNAINKYGWDNFKHIVIATGLSFDVASIMEVELIKKYNTTNPNCGYNIALGGAHGKLSEETKEKLRKIRTGKKLSKETIEKLKTYCGEKAYWYGKNRSDETKRKLSEARTGTHMSEDVRLKISKTLTGEGCYWYGKHLSDEHKQKLRDINVGKTIPQETRDKISQSLLNRGGFEISMYSLDGVFIKKYPSVAEAARQISGDASTIVKCCKGKRKYAYNSQWRYSSENIEKLQPVKIRKKKEHNNG